MQIKNIYIFAHSNGGLAQLARAFDWQSKGHRFDSDILHRKSKSYRRKICNSFFYTYIYTYIPYNSKNISGFLTIILLMKLEKLELSITE